MASIHPQLSLKWDLVGVDIGIRRDLAIALRSVEKFRKESRENPPSFFTLPDSDIQPLLVAVRSLGRFRRLVVLGVGGSSLGAEAVVALHQDYKREVTFLDNLDPLECQRVLQYCDPEQTGFVVISKSGTTAEVLAQLS